MTRRNPIPTLPAPPAPRRAPQWALQKAKTARPLTSAEKVEQVRAQMAKAADLGAEAAQLDRSRSSNPYDPQIAPAEFHEWDRAFVEEAGCMLTGERHR